MAEAMGERCAAVEPLLSAWWDGQLDEREAGRVTGHLAGCQPCASALDELSEVACLLGNLPARRAPEPLSVKAVEASGEPVWPAVRRVQALAVATGLVVGAAFALGSAAEDRDVPAPLDAFTTDQFGQGVPGQATLFFSGQPRVESVLDPRP